MVGKYLKVIFVILIMIIFTVNCTKKEEMQKNSEEFDIQVDEKINENLKVKISKAFSEKEVKNQAVLSVEPYPLTEKWAQGLADKYFHIDGSVKLNRNKEYEESFGDLCFDISGDEYYFLAKLDSITFYTDKNFDNEARVYFEDAFGLYPYFKEDAAKYYDQSDLTKMSYQEAQELCTSVLSDSGFSYFEPGIESFTITSEAMRKYREANPDIFNAELDKTGDWLKSDGFYVFCFPTEVNGDKIRGNSIFVDYAQFLVCDNKIISAFIPSKLKVKEQEKKQIKDPQYVLDNIITMYENIILTQKVEIYDLNMIYACTKMNSTQGEGIRSWEYICAPIWEFSVRFTDETGVMEGNVLYNAVTGERIY